MGFIGYYVSMLHRNKAIGKSIPKYFGASVVVGNIILIKEINRKEINRPDFPGGFFYAQIDFLKIGLNYFSWGLCLNI